jgi:hypothetical protein
MRTNLNTVIGPYLYVKGTCKVSTQKVKRVCPNHSKKETNAKFCAECGSPIESVEDEDNKNLTYNEFLCTIPNFWEKLSAPQYSDVMLPTMAPPNKKISVEIEQRGFVDLSDATSIMEKQLQWFNETCVEEISKFKEAFGEENVKVCWGLVTYYS